MKIYLDIRPADVCLGLKQKEDTSIISYKCDDNERILQKMFKDIRIDSETNSTYFVCYKNRCSYFYAPYHMVTNNVGSQKDRLERKRGKIP